MLLFLLSIFWSTNGFSSIATVPDLLKKPPCNVVLLPETFGSRTLSRLLEFFPFSPEYSPRFEDLTDLQFRPWFLIQKVKFLKEAQSGQTKRDYQLYRGQEELFSSLAQRAHLISKVVQREAVSDPAALRETFHSMLETTKALCRWHGISVREAASEVPPWFWPNGHALEILFQGKAVSKYDPLMTYYRMDQDEVSEERSYLLNGFKEELLHHYLRNDLSVKPFSKERRYHIAFQRAKHSLIETYSQVLRGSPDTHAPKLPKERRLQLQRALKRIESSEIRFFSMPAVAGRKPLEVINIQFSGGENWTSYSTIVNAGPTTSLTNISLVRSRAWGPAISNEPRRIRLPPGQP